MPLPFPSAPNSIPGYSIVRICRSSQSRVYLMGIIFYPLIHTLFPAIAIILLLPFNSSATFSLKNIMHLLHVFILILQIINCFRYFTVNFHPTFFYINNHLYGQLLRFATQLLKILLNN
jgi:hypothetical protein